MARPIPLEDKIAYLEVAVEAARLMQIELEPQIARGSFDAIRDYQGLSAHIDEMLDSLSTYYFNRDMKAAAGDIGATTESA